MNKAGCPNFREEGFDAVIAHRKVLRAKLERGEVLSEGEADWLEYVDEKIADWSSDVDIRE